MGLEYIISNLEKESFYLFGILNYILFHAQHSFSASNNNHDDADKTHQIRSLMISKYADHKAHKDH